MQINPNINQFHRKTQRSSAEFVTGILEGNRVLMSQAITLIESTNVAHEAKAQSIIEACLPYSGKSIRIGITGTPGVGKSTFIENFGLELIKKGRRVAVLAIDPSSQVNRGSILGDKTRMMHLSLKDEAYIRPSAAGENLGGVARKTRESIIICEAAGFDVVIIETVGVGQSEVAVHSMVDFFLLLLLPGAGDELQGIKRGIVEMADLIAINKADEDRMLLAKQARAAYANALHLYPGKESNWTAQAVLCSALSRFGLEDIWSLITDYQRLMTESGYFEKHRKQQAKYWLYEAIQQQLQQRFFEDEYVKNNLTNIENAVTNGTLSPFLAAEMLVGKMGE